MSTTGAPIVIQPSTQVSDLGPFIDSVTACPKSGLHNPLRNVSRYLMLGDVSRKAGEYLKSEEGNEYVRCASVRTRGVCSHCVII